MGSPGVFSIGTSAEVLTPTTEFGRQRSKHEFEQQHPCLSTLVSTLLAGIACKDGSLWPLGHVLLLPGSGNKSACYIGAAAPKLLLMVNAAHPQAREVYVVEATAYPNPLHLGILPRACQRFWLCKQLRPDNEFNIEYRDGQGVLNVGNRK